MACTELGSEDAQSFSRKRDNYNLGPFSQKSFDCYGNESSLVRCNSTDIYCNQYDLQYLECKPGHKWGNI